MSFPSELPFCSYLTYSKKDVKSILFRDAIKYHRGLPYDSKRLAIPSIISRFAKELHHGELSSLECFFGEDVAAIPIPGSSPHIKDSLNVPSVICAELKRNGMVVDVANIVERHTKIRKSTFAAPGTRPSPLEHFESTRLASLMYPDYPRILLVDDFITRGSTLVGVYPHIKQACPNAKIVAFCLVSARNFGVFNQLIDPTAGIVIYKPIDLPPGYYLHRQP